MGRTVLITGGSRSGKSSYAQRSAEAVDGRRVFVATCPEIDEEMTARIRRHKQAREGKGWETLEESLKLSNTLRQVGDSGVILIDCLTLWINSLMYEAEQTASEIDEDRISWLAADLAATAKGVSATVFLVTNEVGSGIVPEHPSARLYRDLVGRCNQVVASAADKVIMVVSGIPLEIK